MEDAAFESGQTDYEPPEWAIDADKGELSDDASAEEIRTRAVEWSRKRRVPKGLPSCKRGEERWTR